MITRKPELPVISFSCREAWETWSDQHHTPSGGLWLELAKKGSALETVSLAEALDVALCYGWIDSQADSIDGQH